VTIHEEAQPDETTRTLLRASSFVSEQMRYADFLQGEKVLMLGCELPEVKDMQLKLNELGYELSETDGFFGARTEDAVLDWQMNYGYEATGEISEEQLEHLLSLDAAEEEAKKPGVAAVVRVESALILRSQPSTKSEKLDTLPDGTEVRLLETAGGWSKIQVNGKTGYAGSKYIETLQ